MNLYEKIAAEIITAFTLIAALIAFLDDRRKKRKEDRANFPTLDKCDQLERTMEKRLGDQDDKLEKVKDKVGDAFTQIGENRVRIIMMLEFLKNKSF